MSAQSNRSKKAISIFSRFIRTAVIAIAILAISTICVNAQDVIAIRGGTVYTMAGDPIEESTVIIRGSKIEAVGKSVSIPQGAEIIDASGKHVIPGIVDAMTYYGIRPFSRNVDDPVTPKVRIIQAYYPFGVFMRGEGGIEPDVELLRNGITTMYIAPGNSQVISGQGAVVKTFGRDFDNTILREPAAVDMTLGDPPKKPRTERKTPTTRMAVSSLIREALIKAQEFERENGGSGEKKRDLDIEPLVSLLHKEIPARMEADFVDDIRMAIRLADEYDIDVVIDGGMGAYKMKGTLAGRNIPVVLGPPSHPYTASYSASWIHDLYALANDYNAAELINAGVKIAFASYGSGDGFTSRGYQGRWLMLEAGLATGFGVSEEDALKAITINPAEILGVDDRIGSIEAGKDADIVILDGPPLMLKTWAERVYISGMLAYSKENDKQ